MKKAFVIIFIIIFSCNLANKDKKNSLQDKENKDKPWKIINIGEELPFKPILKVEDILKRMKENNGIILGKVLDLENKQIEAATVFITGPAATMVGSVNNTDKNGEFFFIRPSGYCKLEFFKQFYEKLQIDRIKVEIGRITVVKAIMEPAKPERVIVVP